MGIKGLNKIINQYAPSAITQEYINTFANSTVAIDSELLIHRFKSTEGKNSHIYGFINIILLYLKIGILPVFVFDGIPSEAKRNNVLTKRSTQREYIYKKMEELEEKFIDQLESLEKEDASSESESKCESLNNSIHFINCPDTNDTLNQLDKIQKKISFMTVSKNCRNECKYLLKLMGIPFIVADDDAEAFCVTLQRQNIVDYVYTEDTDIIPYFIASLKNNPLSDTDKPIKILRKGYLYSTVTVININEILEKMELTVDSFIDMCILCGCDFCTTINKIGPNKAYNLIKKCEKIEDLESSSGITVPTDFKYQDARDIFFRNHDTPIKKELVLTDMDTVNLRKYMSEERGINPDTIIGKYIEVLEIYKKTTSTTSEIE